METLRDGQRLHRHARQSRGGEGRATPTARTSTASTTWHIHHAEEAFGFAKTGQTIVNVPDAKLMKLYVDDEPLLLVNADLEAYERVLDFREECAPATSCGGHPRGGCVRSSRLVSLAHRHLAMLTFEVTVLDGAARSSSPRSCSTARTAKTSTTWRPLPSDTAGTRARCAPSTTGCSCHGCTTTTTARSSSAIAAPTAA